MRSRIVSLVYLVAGVVVASSYLRWTAAGMLEAEKKFKRVMGYAGPARLAVAVEHQLASADFVVESEEVAELVNV